MRSAVTSIYLALHCLVSVSYVSATDHIPPETYTGFWWHGMHWPAFWWIFPLMFLVMMVIFFVIMRKWSMGCMWRDRMMGGAGLREPMNHSLDEPSESAIAILNKRYAKGEIDKQEYEEKKRPFLRFLKTQWNDFRVMMSNTHLNC
jgi:putative membrane protein